MKTRVFSRESVRKYLLPLVIVLCGLVAWEAVVKLFNVPRFLIPAPSVILERYSMNIPFMMKHTARTLLEALSGFAIGTLVGFGLALVMAYSDFLERSAYPFLLTIRGVPVMALAPILVIWIGFNIYPIIITSAILCFFPMVVNGVTGLRSTDKTVLELMRSYNASEIKVFRHVRIYDSLPYIFAALKLSIGLAVVGAVVGEWVGTTEGLGYLLLIGNYRIDTVLMFESITTLIVIYIALFGIVSLIEGRVINWREPIKQ